MIVLYVKIEYMNIYDRFVHIMCFRDVVCIVKCITRVVSLYIQQTHAMFRVSYKHFFLPTSFLPSAMVSIVWRRHTQRASLMATLKLSWLTCLPWLEKNSK